jgi:hypothetical protein
MPRHDMASMGHPDSHRSVGVTHEHPLEKLLQGKQQRTVTSNYDSDGTDHLCCGRLGFTSFAVSFSLASSD